MEDLVTPCCGAAPEVVLEYTLSSYSEHRDFVGFECRHCTNKWNTDGAALPEVEIKW